jgi:predicted nucleotidyltransferase
MSIVGVSENQRAISPEEIHAIARQIARKFNPQKIILFGSYARGNHHSFSDVDLLVVLEKTQDSIDPEIDVALSVSHRFPMDILVRSPQEISKRLQMGDPFFYEILERGVVLYERSRE